MQKKLHIKKGDTVLVIAGNNKGKKGRVLEIITKSERAIVEGVNMIKKHTKPNAATPQGGIVEKEASIHVSNVMVIDPKTNEPTRIGYKYLEDGSKVRISKKSGEMLGS